MTLDDIYNVLAGIHDSVRLLTFIYFGFQAWALLRPLGKRNK